MADENDGFAEPLGTTLDAAVQLHELMMMYITAGFTRAEAFDLVKSGLLESMRNQGS